MRRIRLRGDPVAVGKRVLAAVHPRKVLGHEDFAEDVVVGGVGKHADGACVAAQLENVGVALLQSPHLVQDVGVGLVQDVDGVQKPVVDVRVHVLHKRKEVVHDVDLLVADELELGVADADHQLVLAAEVRLEKPLLRAGRKVPHGALQHQKKAALAFGLEQQLPEPSRGGEAELDLAVVAVALGGAHLREGLGRRRPVRVDLDDGLEPPAPVPALQKQLVVRPVDGARLVAQNRLELDPDVRKERVVAGAVVRVGENQLVLVEDHVVDVGGAQHQVAVEPVVAVYLDLAARHCGIRPDPARRLVRNNRQ